jgi:hypothetical protein
MEPPIERSWYLRISKAGNGSEHQKEHLETIETTNDKQIEIPLMGGTPTSQKPADLKAAAVAL